MDFNEVYLIMFLVNVIISIFLYYNISFKLLFSISNYYFEILIVILYIFDILSYFKKIHDYNNLS